MNNRYLEHDAILQVNSLLNGILPYRSRTERTSVYDSYDNEEEGKTKPAQVQGLSLSSIIKSFTQQVL